MLAYGVVLRARVRSMSTFLVILADTHLPRRARDLPAELWTAIESADVVIHAGDWMDVALFDELESRVGSAHGRGGRLIGPELVQVAQIS